MAEKVTKTKAPAKTKAVAAADTTKKVAAKKAVVTKPAVAKKAVAAKKPAAAKKQTVSEKVIASTPSHEEIALLALRYWAERGHEHGHDEQDWLRAEQELMQVAS